ncbi:hypothetical protein C8Q77DRAFT_919741 [Trametes polyzona]|nr:hypothetical protein C8Q77DRAFT_919741 [Trametes polyzona]
MADRDGRDAHVLARPGRKTYDPPPNVPSAEASVLEALGLVPDARVFLGSLLPPRHLRRHTHRTAPQRISGRGNISHVKCVRAIPHKVSVIDTHPRSRDPTTAVSVRTVCTYNRCPASCRINSLQRPSYVAARGPSWAGGTRSHDWDKTYVRSRGRTHLLESCCPTRHFADMSAREYPGHPDHIREVVAHVSRIMHPRQCRTPRYLGRRVALAQGETTATRCAQSGDVVICSV